MTSKTTITKQVRSFDVAGVTESLDAAPDLLQVRDERGRTWLHLCCSVDVTNRSKVDRHASVVLAAALIERGLNINDSAFTEGTWRATPVWFSVARGHNLDLAEFLLERGADPNHALFAASFNDDFAAIDLLLDHGADISESEHFLALARFGPRYDTPGPDGVTAAELLSRKRDLALRALALSSGAS